MSDRLVPHWDANNVVVFGENGAKGQLGEYFIANVVSSWGASVFLFESERVEQVSGVDLVFYTEENKQHTVDVKNNITRDGTFYVEIGPDGWLFSHKKISTWLFHCNHVTQQTAVYKRKDMIDYLEGRGIIKYPNKLFPITPSMQLDFIKRKKMDL